MGTQSVTRSVTRSDVLRSLAWLQMVLLTGEAARHTHLGDSSSVSGLGAGQVQGSSVWWTSDAQTTTWALLQPYSLVRQLQQSSSGLPTADLLAARCAVITQLHQV